jgi:hypothetical protein
MLSIAAAQELKAKDEEIKRLAEKVETSGAALAQAEKLASLAQQEKRQQVRKASSTADSSSLDNRLLKQQMEAVKVELLDKEEAALAAAALAEKRALLEQETALEEVRTSYERQLREQERRFMLSGSEPAAAAGGAPAPAPPNMVAKAEMQAALSKQTRDAEKKLLESRAEAAQQLKDAKNQAKQSLDSAQAASLKERQRMEADMEAMQAEVRIATRKSSQIVDQSVSRAHHEELMRLKQRQLETSKREQQEQVEEAIEAQNALAMRTRTLQRQLEELQGTAEANLTRAQEQSEKMQQQADEMHSRHTQQLAKVKQEAQKQLEDKVAAADAACADELAKLREQMEADLQGKLAGQRTELEQAAKEELELAVATAVQESTESSAKEMRRTVEEHRKSSTSAHSSELAQQKDSAGAELQQKLAEQEKVFAEKSTQDLQQESAAQLVLREELASQILELQKQLAATPGTDQLTELREQMEADVQGKLAGQRTELEQAAKEELEAALAKQAEQTAAHAAEMAKVRDGTDSAMSQTATQLQELHELTAQSTLQHDQALQRQVAAHEEAQKALETKLREQREELVRIAKEELRQALEEQAVAKEAEAQQSMEELRKELEAERERAVARTQQQESEPAASTEPAAEDPTAALQQQLDDERRINSELNSELKLVSEAAEHAVTNAVDAAQIKDEHEALELAYATQEDLLQEKAETIEQVKTAHAAELEQLQNETAEKLAAMGSDEQAIGAKLEEMKQEAAAEKEQVKTAHAAELEQLQNETAEKLAAMGSDEQAIGAKLEETKQEAAAEKEQLEAAHLETINELHALHKDELAQMERELVANAEQASEERFTLHEQEMQDATEEVREEMGLEVQKMTEEMEKLQQLHLDTEARLSAQVEIGRVAAEAQDSLKLNLDAESGRLKVAEGRSSDRERKLAELQRDYERERSEKNENMHEANLQAQTSAGEKSSLRADITTLKAKVREMTHAHSFELQKIGHEHTASLHEARLETAGQGQQEVQRVVEEMRASHAQQAEDLKETHRIEIERRELTARTAAKQTEQEQRLELQKQGNEHEANLKYELARLAALQEDELETVVQQKSAMQQQQLDTEARLEEQLEAKRVAAEAHTTLLRQHRDSEERAHGLALERDEVKGQMSETADELEREKEAHCLTATDRALLDDAKQAVDHQLVLEQEKGENTQQQVAEAKQALEDAKTFGARQVAELAAAREEHAVATAAAQAAADDAVAASQASAAEAIAAEKETRRLALEEHVAQAARELKEQKQALQNQLLETQRLLLSESAEGHETAMDELHHRLEADKRRDMDALVGRLRDESDTQALRAKEETDKLAREQAEAHATAMANLEAANRAAAAAVDEERQAWDAARRMLVAGHENEMIAKEQQRVIEAAEAERALSAMREEAQEVVTAELKALEEQMLELQRQKDEEAEARLAALAAESTQERERVAQTHKEVIAAMEASSAAAAKRARIAHEDAMAQHIELNEKAAEQQRINNEQLVELERKRGTDHVTAELATAASEHKRELEAALDDSQRQCDDILRQEKAHAVLASKQVEVEAASQLASAVSKAQEETRSEEQAAAEAAAEQEALRATAEMERQVSAAVQKTQMSVLEKAAKDMVAEQAKFRAEQTLRNEENDSALRAKEAERKAVQIQLEQKAAELAQKDLDLKQENAHVADMTAMAEEAALGLVALDAKYDQAKADISTKVTEHNALLESTNEETAKLMADIGDIKTQQQQQIHENQSEMLRVKAEHQAELLEAGQEKDRIAQAEVDKVKRDLQNKHFEEQDAAKIKSRADLEQQKSTAQRELQDVQNSNALATQQLENEHRSVIAQEKNKAAALLADEVRRMTSEKDELNLSLVEAEAKLKAQDVAKANAQRQHDELNQQFDEATENIAKLTKEGKDLSHNLEDVKAELQKESTAKAEVVSSKELLQASKAGVDRELLLAQDAAERVSAELAQVKKTLEETKLQDAQEKADAAAASQAALDTLKDEKEKAVSALEKEKAAVQVELEDSKTEFARAEAAKKASEEQLVAAQKDVADTKKEVADVKQELAAAKSAAAAAAAAPAAAAPAPAAAAAGAPDSPAAEVNEDDEAEFLAVSQINAITPPVPAVVADCFACVCCGAVRQHYLFVPEQQRVRICHSAPARFRCADAAESMGGSIAFSADVVHAGFGEDRNGRGFAF